jgi:hypothetical protein
MALTAIVIDEIITTHTNDCNKEGINSGLLSSCMFDLVVTSVIV